MRRPEYTDPVRRSELITSWGADYWMARTFTPQLRLAYANAGWFIYDLRPPHAADTQ